jgi:hypothetical protein
MRLRLGLLAVLALAVAPAPASAQLVSIEGTGPGGAETAIESSVKATGQVRVDFHGNGVSGTVTWSPGRSGGLAAFGYRKKGQRSEAGFLFVGEELGYGGQGGTSARVRREGGSLCADVASSAASVDIPQRAGSSLDVRLFGATETLRTRCAGPLASDIAALLPTRTIEERAMRRGGAKLDFSADREFAAHGFEGTLHSNVVLRVGKSQSLLTGEEPAPTHGKKRDRFLEVFFRIESVSGSLTTTVSGLADPDLCGPLDACGLAGTITTMPSASSGDGYVFAFGSARHSKRDLRRAIGLAPGPIPKGVHRLGYFEWDDDGAVTADLSRAGGQGCSDTAPISDTGLVEVLFGRRLARPRYYGFGALGTRCPGPSPADAGVIASGELPMRELTARRATLRLTQGRRSFSANGYRGSTRADLTLVVRRTGIRERVVVEEVVSDGGGGSGG